MLQEQQCKVLFTAEVRQPASCDTLDTTWRFRSSRRKWWRKNDSIHSSWMLIICTEWQLQRSRAHRKCHWRSELLWLAYDRLKYHQVTKLLPYRSYELRFKDRSVGASEAETYHETFVQLNEQLPEMAAYHSSNVRINDDNKALEPATCSVQWMT